MFRNKKLASILLVAIMIINIMPIGAVATARDEEQELNEAKTTITNIQSIEDIDGIEKTSDSNYKLTKNITLRDWQPIDFGGNLDGNGYSVTLTGNPFFNKFNGTIQNLLLEGEVTASKNVGALAFEMTGGIVQNIWSGASVTAESWNDRAGLIGKVNSGNIKGNLITGEFTPSALSTIYGIAAQGGNGKFQNSYWTSGAKNVARGKNLEKIKNSKITEVEYRYTMETFNILVSQSEGLKTWEIDPSDGIPKPIGRVSDGSNPRLDKRELEEELKRGLKVDDYTSNSWDRYQTALSFADEIYSSTDTTQKKLDEATASLIEVSNELISEANYNNLITQISEAQKLDKEDYTQESFIELESNLSDAESIKADLEDSKGGRTDENVEEIASNLEKAIVELVEWVKISTAEELQEIDGSESYKLTKDIEGFNGNSATLTGKLEGNGKTIEFVKNAKPLFNNIAAGAEIRNIGLLGTVLGGGAFAEVLSGKVFNSYSFVDVDGGGAPAGAIAGVIEKNNWPEASVNNTYAIGKVEGSVTGGIIGKKEKNISYVNLSNSFWVNGEKAIGEGIEESYGSKQKSLEEVKQYDFVKALNDSSGDYGIKWNRNEEGLPYFGVESAEEEDFYSVTMTDLIDESTQTIDKRSQTLVTDIFGQEDGYVAKIVLNEYDGEVTWETISKETNSPITVALSSGKVFVRAAGEVEVKAIDKATGEEIQKFILKTEKPKEFELILKVDSKKDSRDYAGETYTARGGKGFNIEPWVKVDGKEAYRVSSSLFTWESSNPSTINMWSNGYVNVKEEGEAKLTVSLGKVKKTIDVTTDYIATKGSSEEIVKNVLDSVVKYQLKEDKNPQFGSEWSILGLTRSGRTIPKEYYQTYVSSVLSKVANENQKESNRWDNKVTETQRLALALTSIGQDPRSVSGVNLLDYSWNKESNFPGLKKNALGDLQGSNELIFALLTVEAHDNFTKPDDATITVDEMIHKLVDKYEVAGGGFGLYNNETISIDLTAMAVQALSKHYENPEVKKVVDDSISMLSDMQGGNGSYGTSESTSQVVVALAEMGIDPDEDQRFIKDGNSVLDGLVNYAQEDGSFAHSISGDSNPMATEQALYALSSLELFYKDESSLYDMSDVVFGEIEEVEVDGIKLSTNYINIKMGETSRISASVTPENASNKKVIWTSDNEKIATVDQNGLVKGISEGNANIIGTTESGNKFGVSSVKIEAIDLKKEEISSSNPKLEIKDDYDDHVISIKEEKLDKALEINISSSKKGKVTLNLYKNMSLPEIKVKKDVISASIPKGLKIEKGNSENIELITTKDTKDKSINEKLKDKISKDKDLEKIESIFSMGGTEKLEFNKFVTLKFEGLKGKDAAYIANEELHEIKKYTTNKAGESSGELEYSYDDGNDLIVKTKHFTDFIAYTSKDKKKVEDEVKEDRNSISISIDKLTINKGYVLQNTNIEFTEGESVWDVLKRKMSSRGIGYSYNNNSQYGSVYIESIDGDGEFDHGPGSGWMYSVNGVYPEYGVSKYYLKDGDRIKIRYTTNLGKDLGRDNFDQGEDKEPDKEDDEESKEEIETNLSSDKPKITIKDDNKNYRIPVKVGDENKKTNIVIQENKSSKVILDVQKGIALPEIEVRKGLISASVPKNTKIKSGNSSNVELITSKNIKDKKLEKLIKTSIGESQDLEKVQSAFTMGGNERIEFDKFITLRFSGLKGSEAAYIEGEKLYNIEKYGNDKDGAKSGKEEYAYYEGDDLLVKTKHFTDFIAYSAKEVEVVEDPIVRLKGSDRYGTAAAISKYGWEKSNTVILARGDEFPDSIAGVGLSKKLDAPILLAKNDELNRSTKREIKRLGAKNVIVLGGEAAISKEVEEELKSYGLATERIAGKDRYETAAKIAEKVIQGKSEKSAIIVYGRDFPDALSAAPKAADSGQAILMVESETIPKATKEFLEKYDIKDTKVIGGSKVISDRVLSNLPAASRIAGKDRHETAVKVAGSYNSTSFSSIFIASGDSFSDTLALATLGAKLDGKLVLVQEDKLSISTESLLKTKQESIEKIFIAGGDKAISGKVKKDLEEYIK